MPQKMKLPPGAVLVDSQPQPMRLPPGATLVPQVQAPQSEEPEVAPPAMDISGNVLSSMGHAISSTAHDVGAGFVKGLGQNAATVSGWLNKLPYVGETLAPKQGVTAFKQITTPDNFPQKLGAGIEQGAELMAPSGAIGKGVKAASAFGTGARVAARMGLDALATGGNAAMHDQSPVVGAAFGAGGAAVSEGLSALAPKLAETALGIRAADRMHGKTPGVTALTETRGVRPGTIAREASEKTSQLTADLDAAAHTAQTPATTHPAVQVLDDAYQTAQKRNSAVMMKRINAVKDQLTRDVTTGQPLPNPTSPEQVLNLKRGINELVKSWSREEQQGIQPIVKRVYGALDKEVDRTIPGAEQLNQRISSLITVGKRAGQRANNAGFAQRVMGRAAAHTGALAGTLAGGTYGYQTEGVPGMIKYGALGLMAPELASSPTVQMGAARMMASPTWRDIASPAARGFGLQLTRPIFPSTQRRLEDME